MVMGLSELQKDIIAKIIAGESNSEIAEGLNWSKGKIKKELDQIYRYFRINNPDPTAKRIILVREVMKLEFSSLMM